MIIHIPKSAPTKAGYELRSRGFFSPQSFSVPLTSPSPPSVETQRLNNRRQNHNREQKCWALTSLISFDRV